jgi:hypothetical protein
MHRLQERPGAHPSELAMVEDLCDDHEVFPRSVLWPAMQAYISILAQPTFSPGAMQEHAKMARMLRSVLGNQANLKKWLEEQEAIQREGGIETPVAAGADPSEAKSVT